MGRLSYPTVRMGNNVAFTHETLPKIRSESDVCGWCPFIIEIAKMIGKMSRILCGFVARCAHVTCISYYPQIQWALIKK